MEIHPGRDASPAQCAITTHTHILVNVYGQFSAVNLSTDMFLEGGRKPEEPEETHKDTVDIPNSTQALTQAWDRTGEPGTTSDTKHIRY